MKKQLLLIIAIAAFCMMNAQIIHIPADQTTIQAGIDAASDGDTVLVAQGTYHENVDFSGKKITLASHYLIDPDSSHILNTVIDGSQPSHPDSASAVYFTAGTDTSTVLCGFIIKNGEGTYPVSSFGYLGGGGIYIQESGAKIIHNVITNNELEFSGFNEGTLGAGICAINELPEKKFLILKFNAIINNSGKHNGSGNLETSGGGLCAIGMHIQASENNISFNKLEGHTMGCGIDLYQCSGYVRNNNIEGNHAIATQSNSWSGGLNIQYPDSGFVVSKNTFTNNVCEGDANTVGGAIGILWGNDNPVIIDGNIINGNIAKHGGGIFYRECPYLRITNNLIYDNTADLYGGGIFVSNVAPLNRSSMIHGSQGEKDEVNTMNHKSSHMSEIVNNTLVNNMSVDKGGCIATNLKGGEKFLIYNNIFYENQALNEGDEIYTFSDGEFYLYHNDIDTNQITGAGESAWNGEGNVYVDPMFEGETFGLSWFSQCIDMAADSLLLDGIMYCCPNVDIYDTPRIYGWGQDIGAVESQYWVGVRSNKQAGNSLSIKISPNPVSDIIRVSYYIPEDSFVLIKVYDLNGIEQMKIEDRLVKRGDHQKSVSIDGLPSGIYMIKLISSNQTATELVVIAR